MRERVRTIKNVVIYGYGYEQTEGMIDRLTNGRIDFSSIYVNEGIHCEDKLLCHLKLHESEGCPYIQKGGADTMIAGEWEDAVRYFEWIGENGTVIVGRDGGNARMKEFILKQEAAGFIKVVYPQGSML